jgi:hypothetical protein
MIWAGVLCAVLVEPLTMEAMPTNFGYRRRERQPPQWFLRATHFGTWAGTSVTLYCLLALAAPRLHLLG